MARDVNELFEELLTEEERAQLEKRVQRAVARMPPPTETEPEVKDGGAKEKTLSQELAELRAIIGDDLPTYDEVMELRHGSSEA